MSIKAITFLGLGPYHEAAYFYEDKEYITSLFPLALAEFCDPQPEQWIVCVTKESIETEYFQMLKTRLKAEPFLISWGKDEEQLWEIFNALVELVEPGDQVIFDITHGLRSLPMIVFLAATYLKAAKNIELKGVFYGAFDVRDRNVTPNRTPVFDLTPFLTLLDWLTATERFTQTGNATALAEQLRQNQEPSLLKLAETVEDIATGLHLLRPKETSVAAANLPEAIKHAQAKLPPPFMILADRIEASYSSFGSTTRMNDQAQLGYELEMVNWYHQRGQIVHALSMAREWVISFLCIHFGLDTTDWQARNEMEFLIGGGKKKGPKGEVLRESPYRTQWNTVPQHKRLRKLWVKGAGFELADLRNDVLHSGFRKNPKPADELKSLVDNVIAELNRIATELGYTAESPQ